MLTSSAGAYQTVMTPNTKEMPSEESVQSIQPFIPIQNDCQGSGKSVTDLRSPAIEIRATVALSDSPLRTVLRLDRHANMDCRPAHSLRVNGYRSVHEADSLLHARET